MFHTEHNVEIFKPAASIKNNINRNNLDSTLLTDIRTSHLYNTFNFNCQVTIENINFTKLSAVNKKNMENLKLPDPRQPANVPSKKKCLVSFDDSLDSLNIDSLLKPIQSHVKSPGLQCKSCKRFFKGKRGLSIHLGRNPNCKPNSKPASANTAPDEDNPSLPQQILQAVKCPSTSIESLQNTCGNGLKTKITNHNSKHGCKLCDTLSTKDHFVSSSTHRMYEAAIPDIITSLDCNCTNVIYLITCRKCQLQYVGETAQLLRDRIRHHSSCINHAERDNTCRILSEHFSKGLCKNATFTVNIIEKLQGNGRDEHDVIDSAITAIRRKKETSWMLKLRTVFPYGMNDRIGDEYMSEKESININSKFPPLKRIKDHHKVRSKLSTSNDFICKNFLYIVNESFRTNLKNTMNLIRVLLSSLKKSSCKKLLDTITDFLAEKHDSYMFSQYLNAALDILSSKVGPMPIQPCTTKTFSSSSSRCHIKFDNKAIDFVNPQKILRDKDIINCLPKELRKDSPMVVYELTETIHSKLFNYKKFVQSIDVDSFISDSTILPCNCDGSPFRDEHHEHIITGNLEIVSDTKLRKLISKGPKYREPVQFSCNNAKTEILKGIDKCIDTWSNKAGLPVAAFADWKNNVIRKMDDRIMALANNRTISTPSIFKDANVKKCLSDLQMNYVMVPIDKAANNVAFVCKRYYATVILKELGLDGSSTSTYSKIENQSPDEIINLHKVELNDRFKLKVEDSMSTLPDIYWTPKLHKNPIKSRFIIASKNCTVKHLSKNISSIFCLFNKMIETYNKKAAYYSGINAYWIVQNRDPVLEAVKKSVHRKSAKCVSSFDFSTLYTKIPHDKLIDVLHKIIDFVFKGGTRKKIAIDKHGTAYWSGTKKTSSFLFTKDSIIDAVSFLIKNCYFKFGDKLFRQDIGIPMGSDPAPFFANLFLYHYESTWIKSIKKTNNILARKFGKVFRYIDDLLALNDGHSFQSYHHEIYPSELQLNKENEVNTETNFLDLHINIEDRVFTTKLYDKRDNFGFDITRLPYRNSNIPCRMFYSSIAAECLRICRATSSDHQAIASIKSLLARMDSQGADRLKMKNFITKAFNRHHINQKFGIADNSFVNRIFL